MDDHTYFRIGSFSKVFTTLAILKLVDQHQIDLQKPIHFYLPWFKIKNNPAYSDQITVAHLLGHTSGISREFACVFSAIDGTWQPLPDLKSCVNDVEFHAAPGQRLKYSNVGFAILGQLIAAIESGNPEPTDQLVGYSDYMRREILRPLGMEDAKYDLLPIDQSFLAQGYGPLLPDKTRNLVPAQVSALANTPEYYLALTQKDLGAVMRVLRAIGLGTDLVSQDGKTILPASLLHQMFENRKTDLYSFYQYGFGLTYMTDASGRFLIGHSGGAPGYRVYFVYDPAQDVAATAMTNVPEQISRSIVDTLLKNFTATQTGVILSNDTTTGSSLTNDVKGPFSGTYNDWAFSFSIFTTGYDADGRSQLDILYDGKRRTLMALPGQPYVYRIPEEGTYANQPGETIAFDPPSVDGRCQGLTFAFGYRFQRLNGL